MNPNEATILFGSSDLGRSSALRLELRAQGHRVAAAGSSRDLLDLAVRHSPDVVVLEETLEPSGIDLIAGVLRHRNAGVRIILVLREGEDPALVPHRAAGPWKCLIGPYADSELREAVLSALQDRRDATRTHAPPVVLCVDDDPQYLRSMVRILERRGYRVIACGHSDQVLETIPIARPGMVFLDVLMPGMNGLDLAAELRERLGSSIPLVLLSARSSDAEILEGYHSGATYYLTKPCEARRIGDVADYFIGRIGAGEREALRLQI